jgi:hypothetical protein
MKEYFLVPGDILEMPDTEQNIRICKKANNKDFYLLVLKNGKPFWLDISIFSLRDYYGHPAHDVCQAIRFEGGCRDFKDDVLAVLGKTIECGEWKEIIVPYDDLGNTETVKIVQMKFKQ